MKPSTTIKAHGLPPPSCQQVWRFLICHPIVGERLPHPDRVYPTARTPRIERCHGLLSYAKSARAAVEVLAEDLGGLGYEAWFDKSLEGGQHWWDAILQEIRECDCFICCLTQDSIDSQACQLELAYAVELGRSLLPVVLDDDVQSSLLPPGLATIQHIDYTLADKTALTALSRALAGLETSTLPDPLPEPPSVPLSKLAHLKVQIDDDAPLDADAQEALFFALKGHLKDGKEREAARQRQEPRDGAAAVPMRFVPDLSQVKRGIGKVRWTDRVELPSEAVMDLGAAAIRGLGHTVKEMQPLKLIAKSNVSFFSWGEVLTVELVPLTDATTMVTIESSPAAPLQVVDWGKSVRNVTSILETMATLAADRA